MNRFILLFFVLAAPFYLHAQAPIDLTFSGELVLPSCNIAFSNGDEDGSNMYTTNFGDVNVSDIRYYAKDQVRPTYTYLNEKISEIYHIKISGCTAASVSEGSNGKQFTLTLTPGAGTEWVNATGGDNFMGGD